MHVPFNQWPRKALCQSAFRTKGYSTANRSADLRFIKYLILQNWTFLEHLEAAIQITDHSRLGAVAHGLVQGVLGPT